MAQLGGENDQKNLSIDGVGIDSFEHTNFRNETKSICLLFRTMLSWPISGGQLCIAGNQ